MPRKAKQEQHTSEHVINQVMSFIERAKTESKPGGKFANAGLAIPLDANIETLNKAINNPQVKQAISKHTGLDETTIDFLIGRSTDPSQQSARMLLSLTTAIAAKNEPAVRAHLEKNQILSSPRIPAMLVYMHKYHITHPDVLKEHVDRAIWYVRPLSYQAQQHLRRAAEKVFEQATGDPNLSSRMAKEITLDSEEHVKELFGLMSHTAQSNEEAERADLARAIFIAKNKPYLALYTAALAPTSIQTTPSVNLLASLASMMPLLSGHKTFGSHSSLSFTSTGVSSQGVAKLQGLLELSKMALQDKDVPEMYRDAVQTLRKFADRLEQGVEYNNKTYKLSKKSLTPESLMAAFLVAQHDSGEMFKVWSSATHIGKKIFAFNSIHDSVHSYVIAPIRRYAKQIEQGKYDDLFDAESKKQNAELLRQYADNLSQYLKEASVSYLRDRDISKLKSLGEQIDKAHKAFVGAQQSEDIEEPIARTKQRISGYVAELEREDKPQPLTDVQRQVERVIRPSIKDYGKLPGYFGLGPKIGAYATTLMGNLRNHVIDTWMYRMGTTVPKAQAGGKVASLADIRFEYLPHLTQTVYSDEALKEAQQAVKLAFGKPRKSTQAVLEAAKEVFSENGIPHEYIPHILSSDSSNQSWSWHLLRWSMAKGRHDPPSPHDPYHISSSLDRTAHYVATNDNWYENNQVTLRPKRYYQELIRDSTAHIFDFHQHLNEQGLGYHNLIAKPTPQAKPSPQPKLSSQPKPKQPSQPKQTLQT